MSNSAEPPGASTPTASDTDELIRAIYDCALNPDGWDATFERLRGYLNACAIHLIGQNDACGHSILPAPQLPAERGPPYQTYWFAGDRWAQVPAEVPAGQAGRAAPESPLTWRGTAGYRHFFNDWLLGRDLKDVLAIPLWVPGPEWPAPPDTAGVVLCAIRGQHAEYFTEQDHWRLQGLAPHLGRAFRLGWRLAALERSSVLRETIVNHFNHPVLLLGVQRSILEANPAGQALLGASPAVIKLHQGKLQALGQRMAPAIDEAFCQASQGSPVRLVFVYAGQNGALETGSACLRALPAASAAALSAAQSGHLLMLKLACTVNEDGFQAFCGLFGLSKGEGTILRALLEEPDPAAVAAKQELQLATIRTHIGNIREKTGARRLAELLRMAQNAARPI